MTERENLKIHRIFVLTAILAVACPISLIMAFDEYLIDETFLSLGIDDDAIYYVIGLLIILGLFGLLSAYMVYNKVKDNVTTRSKAITFIFLPILLFGTSVGVIYFGTSYVPEDRGPYLSWMDDPKTTMTISFERKVAGDYILYHGTTASTLTSQASISRSALRTSDGYYHYTVNITGLSPGTTYYYNIPGFHDAPTAFKTAPSSTTKFKFLLYGDSREDHGLFGNEHVPLINQIRNQIDITQLGFIINTGDLAITHDNIQAWNYHFHAIKEIAKSVPYFVASGNHEWNNDDKLNLNVQPALEIQDFPVGNNPSAHVYSLNETSFSFGYGSAFFIFLGYSNTGSNNTNYMNWLDQQLQIGNNSFDFTFVSLHRPPFDDREGISSDDNMDIVKNECPMFHNWSVDAVFAGHNHVLAHQNITLSSDPSGRNVTYIIAGGGGAPLRTPQYGTWNNKYDANFVGKTVYCKGTYHYYVVEIDGPAKTATFTAYELGGAMLENFTIKAYTKH